VVTPTQQYTSTTRPVAVRGDFDGDGRDDIFWYVAGSGADTLWSGSSRSTTDTVTASRFSAQTINISGTYTPVVGDFDGNGRDDILWYGKGTLADSVWYFTGRGSLDSRPLNINGNYTPVVGNFNTASGSTGQDDIFWYASGYASLWSGASNRTFSTRGYSPTPPSNARVYAGNWRQSPTTAGATVHEDLLFYVPGTGADAIWVGNGTGSFTSSSVTINGSYNPIIANFDTSAGPEMTDIFWYAPGKAADSVWMNNGSGFTSIPQVVSGTSYKPVALPGRQPSSHDDILWNNPTGNDFVWRMKGAERSFAYDSLTPASFGGTDMGSRSPLVGDFDTSDANDTRAAVTGGDVHSCALTSTGGVRCWGGGTHGRLGNGESVNSTTPVAVTGLSSGVRAVVAGGQHTCALTSGGAVKCWGYNAHGQLGNGTNTSSTTPVDVSGLSSGVTSITAGSAHTCARISGGVLKCWGYNADGQLGNGTNTNSNVPVDVVDLPDDARSVSAGANHTCATTDANGVICWGQGTSGQLGNGTTTSSTTPVEVTDLASGVSAIDAGGTHTCAVVNGGARCWGAGASGRLGNGTTTNASTPVAVTGLTSGVRSINAGGFHSCALTTTGVAKCWGSNGGGRLGNGTTTNATTPVDVIGLPAPLTVLVGGNTHTCGISENGEALCWGTNTEGRLGNGTTTSATTPQSVGGGYVPIRNNPANLDLLWWAPGNASTQTEVMWVELETT
jgi:alpha-tubulin suppressor-like RCC1 family protein